ncbi:hypothetical protein G3I54_21245 [Streptomyces sp. SID14515]|nr:hypothetical protein [Streptomyces sp. SID14515]
MASRPPRRRRCPPSPTRSWTRWPTGGTRPLYAVYSKNLPRAVNSVIPTTVLQLCIVHFIRTTLKCVPLAHWDTSARDLRPAHLRPVRAKPSPDSPS